MMNNVPSFYELLGKDLSESLTLMLGDSPAEALMYYIGFPESVRDPEVLADRLSSTLGPGALVVEKAVIKTLYRDLKQVYEETEGFSFVREIRNLSTGGQFAHE